MNSILDGDAPGLGTHTPYLLNWPPLNSWSWSSVCGCSADPTRHHFSQFKDTADFSREDYSWVEQSEGVCAGGSLEGVSGNLPLSQGLYVTRSQ